MDADFSRPRPARAEDAAAILALEAHFPGDRLSPRAVLRLLRSASARVWVVDGNDGVAGALVLLTRAGSATARIYSLAIAPAARGQGLARALVRQAEAHAAAAGLRALSLEVRQDNAAARALYSALGYAPVRVLPGYYDDGADGLRLRKELR